MSSALLRALSPDFCALAEELGLEVYYERYDAQSFGNIIVALHNDALRIRIIKDRDFVDGEVSALGGRTPWVYVSDLVELVRNSGVDVRFEKNGDADDLCRVVRQAYPAMCGLLSKEEWDSTKQKLEDVRIRRAGELWGAEYPPTADMLGKPLELKFTDAAGNKVGTTAYRGKILLVYFWASWSPSCGQETPNLVRIHKAHHKDGLEVLGISFDHDRGEMEAFVKQGRMTWPQCFYGQGGADEIRETFGIRSDQTTGLPRVPVTFVVDRYGIMRGVDTWVAELEELIDRLLR